jgi:hypothetical protein
MPGRKPEAVTIGLHGHDNAPSAADVWYNIHKPLLIELQPAMRARRTLPATAH